jgi:hypothetical protein
VSPYRDPPVFVKKPTGMSKRVSMPARDMMRMMAQANLTQVQSTPPARPAFSRPCTRTCTDPHH